MKTVKAFIKWLNNDYLEPKEQRKLDSIFLDVAAAGLTLVVVIVLLAFFYVCGVFG